MDALDTRLNEVFPGRVVRKDLTKLIKEGANVPVYVLEYLLGMYCATSNEEEITEGVKSVKKILAENYVRPDEAEKIKSKIKESGRYSIIDKVTVRLNEKKDMYVATLLNLGIKDVEVTANYVKEFEKLLAGGIWCILQIEYNFNDDTRHHSPFEIQSLKPIQMPNMDMDEVFDGRKKFTKEEWIDVLLRSVGMEPEQFKYREKWHLLARLVPLCENNYNLCELGPRGTGKSHIYKEISPNSILVSGGQTTVANLFYNMASKAVGLVGLWDVVAFDEVAGISFKDKDGVQIMKDFMASGSFARGKDAISANASMVFVGNINQSIETLVKTSHLFEPFPETMIDTAFFDRFHNYIPGWEIPKMRPEYFTNKFGFIVDYLAEFLREMRKRNFSDAINKYFKLGNNLNQRDVIAVKKTVSGMLKLLFPDEQYTVSDVKECLNYALETRRRIKEQLKKLGGMEFYDVHFSYVENESFNEFFVSVPEQGGNVLIPEGAGKAGHIYTVARGDSDMFGVYKLELQVTDGSGKFVKTGAGKSVNVKESINTGFNYFKANASRISASIKTDNKDFLIHIIDLQGAGASDELSLTTLITLCSGILNKPIQEQMAVIGSMTIGGTISQLDNLANTLQVASDAGARKILLPMSCVPQIPTVPADLFSKFQIAFYADPIDAVFKALGVK